jgi:type I restriction enzyme S subunit
VSGSWPTRPLGDVVDVLDHRRVPVSAVERAKRPGSVPYYGAAGRVGSIDEKLFDEPLLLLGEDGVQFFDQSKTKAYLIDGPSWVNNHAHVLRPRPDVDRRWLLHYLNVFDYDGYANGTTRLKLTKSSMTAIPVPVPPLDEQHRIVAALEDHLSRLDAAGDYLDAAALRSRRAEQALIDEMFVAQAQAEDWPHQALADFARGPRAVTDGPFGSNLTSAHYAPDGALVLRLQNIGDGHFRQAEAFITLEHYEALRVHDVRKDDVVIASLGEELPRAALVPDLGVPAIVKADCIRVRPDADVDPRWLVYACRSRPAKRHAAALVKGVGRQRLGLKGIRSIPVPRLPRPEQERHLDKLEEQLSELARLRDAIASGHVRKSALQRALLTAAFSGGL